MNSIYSPWQLSYVKLSLPLALKASRNASSICMSCLLNRKLHGALLLKHSVTSYRRAKFRIQDFSKDLRFRSVSPTTGCMVDLENNRTSHQFIFKQLLTSLSFFGLHRRLPADYIDYVRLITLVVYARGLVIWWPDLVIKSTVEPKRFHILDVRKSSFEVDRRVPGNRDEFPFPLPSCL